MTIHASFSQNVTRRYPAVPGPRFSANLPTPPSWTTVRRGSPGTRTVAAVPWTAGLPSSPSCSREFREVFRARYLTLFDSSAFSSPATETGQSLPCTSGEREPPPRRSPSDNCPARRFELESAESGALIALAWRSPDCPAQKLRRPAYGRGVASYHFEQSGRFFLHEFKA
jgi:hypothetical protein